MVIRYFRFATFLVSTKSLVECGSVQNHDIYLQVIQSNRKAGISGQPQDSFIGEKKQKDKTPYLWGLKLKKTDSHLFRTCLWELERFMFMRAPTFALPQAGPIQIVNDHPPPLYCVDVCVRKCTHARVCVCTACILCEVARDGAAAQE